MTRNLHTSARVIGLSIFCAAVALPSHLAMAETFKCRQKDGRMVFSDTECVGGAATETVRRNEATTAQQQREAASVHIRMQRQLGAIESEKEAMRSYQEPRPTPSGTNAAASSSFDEEAIRLCVRDVERRGGTERQKAELITACRTAGRSQQSVGTSADAVSSCVKRVEKTGASDNEKARQIAICHGGDVPPERTAAPPLLFITHCDRARCWDNVGNSYSGDVGPVIRNDGKSCQISSGRVQCN